MNGERHKESGSVCIEPVSESGHDRFPTTIVVIQIIALMLSFSALTLSVIIMFLPYWQVASINTDKSIQIGLWAICNAASESTECSYWSRTMLWKMQINGEPQYVFYSRSFLLFAILIGTIGNFFGIIGSGMVCCRLSFRKVSPVQAIGALFCSSSGMLIGAAGTVFPILFKAPNEDLEQDQINFILKNEYFEIDPKSRAPFQYGMCLYMCWGVMVLYGVGSSLYTFTACLLCCEHTDNRYRSIDTASCQPANGKTNSECSPEVERVVIPETPSRDTDHDETERDDTFEEPLSILQYKRGTASINTSNNASYRKYSDELRVLHSRGESNKIARALSLRDAFETSSVPSNSYGTLNSFPTRPGQNNRSASTTDYSTIKEYDLTTNYKYTTEFNTPCETDNDDKSSMASVSIIASTNQVEQQMASAENVQQSTMPISALVPYSTTSTTDLEEYERMQAGFTAEVCKLINGCQNESNQSARIGMFRLRMVKYTRVYLNIFFLFYNIRLRLLRWQTQN